MHTAGKWDLRLLCSAILLLVVSVFSSINPGLALMAQETTEASSEVPLQVKEGKILSQQRIWILGKDGRPLMQYTLDELRELERVYRETTQLPPSLQSANLSITVGQGSATVTADFDALSGGGGLVRRFDLGLTSCQLIASPSFTVVQEPNFDSPSDPLGALEDESSDLDSQELQQVVPTENGYQWLVLSREPKQYRLTLQGQTVVGQVSDRQSITMDLPMVQTRMIVQLPASAVDERVNSDDLITNRTVDASGVTVEIRSRGGPITLSWGQADAARAIGVVEARSETLYEPFDLSSPSQSWTATTNLSIRWTASHGNQKIQMRLPPGGQWGSLPFSEIDRFRLYTIPDATHVEENGPDEANTTTDPSGSTDILVIENLDPEALPTIENLSLQWRWMPTNSEVHAQSASFTLLAPEISGADSHYGMIRVVYPASYEFSYLEHPGSRFIDHSSLLDSSSNRDQLLFAFSGTSAGVDITFQRERLLPIVRPTYRIHVSENRLEMTAWLHCWFEGGAMEVAWYPSGWTLDEASAAVLREPNAPLTVNAEPLQVQARDDGGFLLSSKLSDNSAVKQKNEQIWRVIAYRSWSPQAEPQIAFQLPAFDRAVQGGQSRLEQGSGQMIITSEQYLNVQHDSLSSRGIWQDRTFPDSQNYLESEVPNPTFYRFLEQGQGAEWVGSVQILPQQIGVQQDAELEVKDDRIEVTQHFELQISNRPLEQLKFLVRSDTLPLSFSAGELTLPFEELPSTDSPQSDAPQSDAPQSDAPRSDAQLEPVQQADAPRVSWREVVVNLRPAMLGQVRVTAKSSILWQSTPTNSTDTQEVSGQPSPPALIEVPLLRIARQGALRSGLSQWKLVPNPKFDVRSRVRQSSTTVYQPVALAPQELDEQQDSIPLAVYPRLTAQTANVIANGIWLQTLLAGSERRDRLAVRIRSSNRQVTIQLPEQAVLEKVAIDGTALRQELAPYDYNANQVAVLLPDDTEHVLEVIYLVSQPLTWAQRLSLVPASVKNVQSTDRYYWQLVTPGVYHLGWCPSELTAEWHWRWQSAWWSRLSDLDQNTLERWIGAASLTRIPLGTNSYVMSGVEQPTHLQVWILSRFAFWLPVGVAAILGALLILNTPALKNPSSIVLIACLIAASAMIWPEMSVLLGQTSLVALVLVVIVWLVQSAVRSRVKRRSIFSSGSQAMQEISGSNPSARVRQSSYTNITSRPATVESTGTD